MGARARDTLHAARLLQSRLMRIVQLRQRQRDRAQADYRLALLRLTADTDSMTLDIVQRALDNDRSAPELAADLRHACTPGIIDAEFPEAAPESEDLPPPLRCRQCGMMAQNGVQLHHVGCGVGAPTEEPAPLTPRMVLDGNEEWGLPARPANEPAEPLADTLPGYRYPEPGEPAVQLPDGRVVAADS